MFPSVIIHAALKPFLIDDVINMVVDLHFGYPSKADYKAWYSERVLKPMLAGFAPDPKVPHAMLNRVPAFSVMMQAKGLRRKRKRELTSKERSLQLHGVADSDALGCGFV